MSLRCKAGVVQLGFRLSVEAAGSDASAPELAATNPQLSASSVADSPAASFLSVEGPYSSSGPAPPESQQESSPDLPVDDFLFLVFVGSPAADCSFQSGLPSGR